MQQPAPAFQAGQWTKRRKETEERKQRNKKTVTRGNVTVRERYQVKTDFIAPTGQILLFYSYALGVEDIAIGVEDVEVAVNKYFIAIVSTINYYVFDSLRHIKVGN